MKTKYFILAAIAAVGLASCTNDEFLGDNSPNVVEETSVDDGIRFGFKLPNATRADIYGEAAATLLHNNFYVTGTKGTEAATYPTAELVFDNYLVHYGKNTAGTTASNTANWEYVGIQPGTGDYTDYTFLTSMDPARTASAQTIKYWDYSKAQYDFMAFSTGEYKAGAAGNESTKTIGVTSMKYGTGLNVSPTVPTAYTFQLPSVTALENTYITDIVEVPQTSYGNEVVLQFKNLGSKVRVALYETVPGYSVKDVQFYSVEGAATPTDLNTDLASSTNAILISPTGAGIPTKGTINVLFPHVGNTNASEQDYNKATATVTPGDDPAMFKAFGALTAQYDTPESHEGGVLAAGDILTGAQATTVNAAIGTTYAAGNAISAEDAKKFNKSQSKNVYLGRTLPDATFAGDKDAEFYKTVFPVSTSSPLILRVNYTLVPIDGASEIIKVYGAKAVVPSTYTVWKPNYAYTYIFKISDNTNGWTSQTNTDPKGLFPITFDAVVAEATDVNAEQRTVTTVATPSITTYQQYHKTDANEYSKTVKNLKGVDADRDIYVQVMDNSISPAKLIGTSPSTMPLLNTNSEEGKSASRLFEVTAGTNISEATVMDALENRTTGIDADDVTGRNGITLTNNTNISNTEIQIVNGVDDNPITQIAGDNITAGQVAKIDVSALTAGTSYAYVYDYTGESTAKVLTTIWQPITTETGTTNVDGLQYIANSELVTWDDGTTASHYTNSENAAAEYLYFSVTTNGGATKTYSFVSVDDKIGTPLPDGLLKISKTQLHDVSGTGNTASADTFYFTTYVHNNGKYAVKVIKIVA